MVAIPRDPRMVRLTEAHRLAQIAVVKKFLPGLNDLWPVLSRDERGWLSQAATLIQDGRAQSRQLGHTYLRAFLEMHGIPVSPDMLGMDSDATERILVSLRATGPAWRAKMLRNHDPEYADVAARRKVLGAAIRHMLDGGRESIVETVNRSGVGFELGYRRVGAVGACDWCREFLDGDVIPGEAGRGYDFDVHDNCACTVEPVLVNVGASDARSGPDAAGQDAGVEVVPMEPEEALKANPRYQDADEAYRLNCTNCVTAYELRRRGEGVVAGPVNESSPGWVPGAGVSLGTFVDRWERDGRRLSLGDFEHASSRSGAVARVEGWGDGARGVVFVEWKGRSAGAHVFNVENIGGAVQFFDAQDGSRPDQAVFDRARAGRVFVLRIDDATLADREGVFE